MKKINALLVGLLLAATLVAVAPALAQDTHLSSEGVLHEKVQYSDLNLSNGKGVEVLYRRITAASKRVCYDYGNEQQLGRLAQIKACDEQAMQTAVMKIGNDALTRYYEVHRGASHVPLTASNAAMPKIEINLE